MKRSLLILLASSLVVGCTDRKPPVAAPPIKTPTPATQEARTPAPATQPSPPPRIAKPTPPAPPPAKPPVITPKPVIMATVNGIEIPRDQVISLLVESFGLNMLMNLVQLDLAKAESAKIGAKVTPADIATELEYTLGKMFKDSDQKLLDKISDAESRNDAAEFVALNEQLRKDHDALLVQFLLNQHLTRTEFDLLMETNAHIRKVVEEATRDKITEDNLREAFMAVYGENIRVRHIQVNNLAEASDVQRRLAAGEAFETVAKDLSRNAANAALGGELPPFSRETPNLPESFKQVAFTLKTPGEVSDPVEANGAYHIIKLIQRIPPKAIKFESVKDSLRSQLYDRWVAERMKGFRNELGKKALESLKISDPVLAKQFSDRLLKRESELKEREQIARELERQRTAAEQTSASSRPAPQEGVPSLPTLRPTATGSTGELRPPATKSGSDTPDAHPTTSPSSQQ